MVSKLIPAVLFLLLPAAAAAAGDPVKGKAQFAKCAMCHSIAPGRTGVGPSLAGVVGRKAGTVRGYKYSSAMQSSGIVWTPRILYDYLVNPRAMVPGSKMMFAGMRKPEDRDNLIAYLSNPR